MMSHLLRLTLKFGLIMAYLVASAAGCFLFTHGFRLIAKDGEALDLKSRSRVIGGSPQ